jgi:DNA-binding CsgD family transcriptional regulator
MGIEDRLPPILATLYSAPLRPEAWETFLSQFAGAFQISKAALLAHDRRAGIHRMLATHGASVRESVADYEKHYWQFDEWTKRATPHNLHLKVARGEEAWPEALMFRSTFYNEFLKPYDTCQMAAIGSFSSDGRIGALSIYRGPSEPSFDNDVIAGLNALIPHLDTALAVQSRLVELEARATDMESALDALPTGLALIDVSGQCLFMNRTALRIVKQRDGLLQERGILRAESSAETNVLRGLIARAAGRPARVTHLGSAARISRRKGSPLNVVVAPFHAADLFRLRCPSVMLLIADPDENPAGFLQVIATLFRLTPAEARLAEALASGLTLSEAAARYEVTAGTVRTQLKAVLRKTETKRQGELVRLLKSIVLPVDFGR